MERCNESVLILTRGWSLKKLTDIFDMAGWTHKTVIVMIRPRFYLQKS